LHLLVETTKVRMQLYNLHCCRIQRDKSTSFLPSFVRTEKRNSSFLLRSRRAMSVSCYQLFYLLPELLCIYIYIIFYIRSQVVELKVGMHCERCIKSIKKAIKTIDGELWIKLVRTVKHASNCAHMCRHGQLPT
jgi:hypothetical protein